MENDGNHTHEVQTNGLKEVANTLVPDSFEKYIEKACQSLILVTVYSLRMLKEPKFELGKCVELHSKDKSPEKLLVKEQMLMRNQMMDTLLLRAFLISLNKASIF